MRILYAETADKSARSFLTLSKETVLEHIQTDHGYHEVIPMIDNGILLRIYIDIDTGGDNPAKILEEGLAVLNQRFGTTDADWAIASCVRPEGAYTKISYHLLSKKYCMRLSDLRTAVHAMNHTGFDTSVYSFDMNDREDNGFFRLPNQSKHSINKPAPALKVESGELSDFLITDTEGLVEFRL